ncbi:hypothetical protein pdam_00012159 [Pocillopora damicornis]|uniref:Uncharacterized protein n=1 Tax=Pocillopora damicornis TaxID=46731 RepID=A0A3M6UKI5_POCDA|nr:hypothetical protein pdam_00012159 [Pocillopora damicornis]
MMFNSCELYQLRVFSSTVKQEAEREEHYDRLLPLPIWQREQKEKAKKLLKEEKKKGEEMRKSAMERLSKTKKSQEDTEKDEEKKEKKRRRSGGEAIECLREKGEAVHGMKEQEF